MGVFDVFQSGGNEIYSGGESLEVAEVMSPEVRDDFQNFEGRDVVVFGNPIETGERLDHSQGDNPYGAAGNCNLVSTSNFLNLCGVEEANETQITGYAIENNECFYCDIFPPEYNGGSGTENMQSILQDFGISSEIVTPENGGSLEEIANRLEEGYVGAMGVNAGYLWDDPNSIGDGSTNHEVTLTGTVRDPESGDLLALTVCDSGDGNACHVVPVDKLDDCYTTVDGADVVFSTEPIRAI